MLRPPAFLLLVLLAVCTGLSTPVPLMTAGVAQELFPVKLTIEDFNGKSVSGAALQLSNYGTVITGVSGIVQLQLKAGKYDLSVSFLSVLVYSGSLLVSGPLDAAIKCAIYDVKVTVTGIQTNATLLGVARVSDKLVTVRSTDATVDFSQLPAGDVSIFLFAAVQGLTRLVAEKELELSKNVVLTLSASPDYRVINARVFDLTGHPVESAIIRLDGNPANVTDATGRAFLFVKDGYHALEVEYYEFNVFEDRNVQVWRDDSWLINATISPLEVQLVDENSAPVRARPTFLQIGMHNFTLTSDSTGVIRLPQAPHAPMSVSVLQNVPSRFVFNGVPVTVNVFTHGLSLNIEVVRAYMLGSLTLKVEVRVGDITVKNATVRLKRGAVAVDKASTEHGYAVLSMSLGVESSVAVSVEASALGQVATEEISVNTSPLIPATMPFAFIPIVMFEVFRRRLRSKLQAPTVSRRKARRRLAAL